MLCPEAVERLPELLNGSLPSEPRAEVEAHLADCAPCREEWEETRQGAAVFSAHLPTDALVALAWDRPLPGLDPDLARRHLDACADCREDLALARESRSRERAEERLAPRRVSWALPASLAAGLVAAALVAGFALGSRRAQTHLAQADAARRQAVETAARFGAETDHLRQVESELRARLARLAAPRINLPVLELLPGSTLTRGASQPRARARPRRRGHARRAGPQRSHEPKRPHGRAARRTGAVALEGRRPGAEHPRRLCARRAGRSAPRGAADSVPRSRTRRADARQVALPGRRTP